MIGLEASRRCPPKLHDMSRLIWRCTLTARRSDTPVLKAGMIMMQWPFEATIQSHLNVGSTISKSKLRRNLQTRMLSLLPFVRFLFFPFLCDLQIILTIRLGSSPLDFRAQKLLSLVSLDGSKSHGPTTVTMGGFSLPSSRDKAKSMARPLAKMTPLAAVSTIPRQPYSSPVKDNISVSSDGERFFTSIREKHGNTDSRNIRCCVP